MRHASHKVWDAIPVFESSEKQSGVFFLWHQNSGQRDGVFSGIVDDTRRVVYSLLNGMKVSAGPEQSSVGVSSQYFQLT